MWFWLRWLPFGILIEIWSITNSHRMALLFKWKIKYKAEERRSRTQRPLIFSVTLWLIHDKLVQMSVINFKQEWPMSALQSKNFYTYDEGWLKILYVEVEILSCTFSVPGTPEEENLLKMSTCDLSLLGLHSSMCWAIDYFSHLWRTSVILPALTHSCNSNFIKQLLSARSGGTKTNKMRSCSNSWH